MTAYLPNEVDGKLPVTCHCESSIVFVSREDIKAGRTASCGRVWCVPGMKPLPPRERLLPVRR